MAVLTMPQLVALAKSVGWSGDNAAIAAAIAKAESGGNTAAHNPRPPDDSYGLWQINMYGAKGPERRKRYNLQSNTQLFVPERNAWVAHDLYMHGGWKHWSVYTNGSYRAHLTAARAALSTPAGNPPDDGGWAPGLPDPGDLNVPNPLEPLVGLAQFVTNPRNWLRLGMFIGGGVLLILGLLMLAGQNSLVRDARGAVVGAVAGKAKK